VRLQNQDVLPFEASQPEAVGIPSQSILRFLQSLEEHRYRLHAFLLMRRGRLCFAGASAPYTLRTPHRVYSAGKSILALSACRAMQDGKLQPTDSIAQYYRDVLHGDTRFDGMTVDSLLTMRSGQVDDPFLAILKDLDADLARLFFTVPPVETPGKTFRYNNTIPSVLSETVERAVGIPFEAYQQNHFTGPMNAPIFAPTNTKGQYNPVVMAMSAVTLMKFTHLFLEEGLWEGKQLVDPAIIRECVREHTQTGMTGNAAGYGWQIWRNAFGGYRMDGGFGQFGIVLPKQDLAAVILSDMPDPSFALEAFADEIVENLSPAPLEADIALQQELVSCANRMSLAPKGGVVHSPLEERWFAGRYRFLQPAIDLRFLADDEALGIVLTENGDEQTYSCGLNGQWLLNDRHLLVAPECTVDNGVYCLDQDACFLTAVWRDHATLEITSKSLAAQGEYLYRFMFQDGGITLTYPPHPCRGWPNLAHAEILHGKGAGL